MKAKFVPFVFLLCMLLSVLPAFAAEANSLDGACEFLITRDGELDFFDQDTVSVRAAYLISLPERWEEVGETITAAYKAYDEIYLIEFGYYNVYPILQSIFLCAGKLEDGTFEKCKTPLDLLSTTFDAAAVERLIITPVVPE